jgi:pimeloyl-ACP methyl ester carboxylesterase
LLSNPQNKKFLHTNQKKFEFFLKKKKMRMMGSSSVNIQLLFVVCFLLIGVELGNAQTGSFTFSACSLDVQTYFKSMFPEYVITGAPTTPSKSPTFAGGRRLEQVETSAEDLFLQRSKFRGGNLPPAETLENAASYYDPIEDKEFSSFQIDGSRFAKAKPSDAYLPSPNAWENVKKASTGCSDCISGCCDAADIALDCGTMLAPLDYNSSSQNITLRVYRVRLMNPDIVGTKRQHLWILQGGPGGSGLSILFLAVPSLMWATDIYVPDHRGTGFSTALTCAGYYSPTTPLSPTYASTCSNYGNYPSKMFTTSAAARDLGLMILDAKSKFSPDKIFVHGYSYGTRWATRFLQMYPALADRVVIEGNVAKDTYFNDFAIGSQIGGKRFMDKCLLDSVCSKYFSSTSLATTITTISNLGKTNKCTILAIGSLDDVPAAANLREAAIRSVVQVLLYFGLESGVDGPYDQGSFNVYIDFRTYALALVSRWSRCNNDGDFRAFAAGLTFYYSLNGGATGTTKAKLALTSIDMFNDILYYTVQYGELRRYPLDSQTTYETNTKNVDWGYVNYYATEKTENDAWSAQRYPQDGFVGNAPTNVQSKVLIINGEVDGQTPRTQAFTQFNDMTVTGAGSKSIAVIPDAGHHASGSSSTCGDLTASFFYIGTTLPTCIITDEAAAVKPLGSDFTINSTYSKTLLGATNPWSGDVSSSFCTSPPKTGSMDYCNRCFDYCQFAQLKVAVQAGQTVAGLYPSDYCTCAYILGACYNVAQVSDPVGQCSNTLMNYYLTLKITAYATYSGQCIIQKSCATGAQSNVVPSVGGGSDIFFNIFTIGQLVIIIVVGAAYVLGFIVFIVVVVKHNRAQREGLKGWDPNSAPPVQQQAYNIRSGTVLNGPVPQAQQMVVQNPAFLDNKI